MGKMSALVKSGLARSLHKRLPFRSIITFIFIIIELTQ